MEKPSSKFSDFFAAVSEAVAHDGKLLFGQHENESVHAVALTTDEGLTSLVLNVATSERLEMALGEYEAMFEEPIADIEGIAEIAWNPDEWGISTFDLEEKSSLAKLSASLFYDGASDAFQAAYIEKYGEDGYWQSYREDFLSGLTQALLAADLPSLVSRDIFQFVNCSEQDVALEDGSSELLNSIELHALFLNRYEISFPFYPKL